MYSTATYDLTFRKGCNFNDYFYGVELPYGLKITPDGWEAVRYYHYDQVESTVALTSASGAITDRFHYVPWGYVLHSVGDSDNYK